MLDTAHKKPVPAKRPATKAAQEKLAQQVVTSLGELFELFDAHFSRSPTGFYKANPYARVAPGAGGEVIFEEAPGYAKLASNHDRLNAMALSSSAQEIFSKAAPALMALFPGQVLRIGQKKTCSDKICLWIGDKDLTGTGNDTQVMETVLSRWKAPLLRLSSYFDGTGCHEEDTRRFLLYGAVRQTPGEIQETQMASIVDAASLSHAFHLSAFNGATGAAPYAKDCGTTYVGELGASLTAKAYVADLSARLEPRRTALHDEIQQKKRETIALFRQASADLVSLAELGAVELEGCLMSNTFDIACHPTRHAHKDDLAEMSSRKDAAGKSVSGLMSKLRMDLLDIHPHLHEATVALEMQPGRVEANALHEYEFTLDRLKITTRTSSEPLLTQASRLAHVVDLHGWNNLRRYVSVHERKPGQVLVNSRWGMDHVDATSLAHAMLLMRRRMNKSQSVHEVIPYRVSDITEAREATRNSADAAFDVPYL